MMKRLVTLLITVLLLIPVVALAETIEVAETRDGINTVEFSEGATLADNDYFTIALMGTWRIPEKFNSQLYLGLRIVNKTDTAMKLFVGSWNSGECDTINGVERPSYAYNKIQAGETFENDWLWITDPVLEDAHDVREMVIHFSAKSAETDEDLPQSAVIVRVTFPEDAFVEVVEPEPEPVEITLAEGTVIADNDYVTVTLTGECRIDNNGYLHLGFRVLNKTDREMSFTLDYTPKEVSVNGKVIGMSSANRIDPNVETAFVNGPCVDKIGITKIEDVHDITIYPNLFDSETLKRVDCDFDPVHITIG